LSFVTAAGYREPRRIETCNTDVRLLLVMVLVVIGCAPRGEAGGFMNGACRPTTMRDAAGVLTTTGQFGLIGSASPSESDQITVVWRNGGINEYLEVTAFGLDPATESTWVQWPAMGSKSATPWGDVGYLVGLKPIGRPGTCWRLVPIGSRMEDGVVIEVRPS
jgi:hypothetical protein